MYFLDRNIKYRQGKGEQVNFGDSFKVIDYYGGEENLVGVVLIVVVGI